MSISPSRKETGEVMGDVVTRFKVARIRSKPHIRRLRSLPCSIPGCCQQPVDAHHLTFGAEAKARGMKASDHFTVPLCRWVHHNAASKFGVHATGNEREWWAKHGLDALALARSHANVSRALGILPSDV